MVEDANPVGTTTFAHTTGRNRGSEGPVTNSAEGDPYLIHPLSPPFEDEGPPLVGVLGHDEPYNRVKCPHPRGGGRRSDDDSYWSVHTGLW